MQWFESEYVTYDLCMSVNGLKDMLYGKSDIIVRMRPPREWGPGQITPVAPLCAIPYGVIFYKAKNGMHALKHCRSYI